VDIEHLGLGSSAGWPCPNGTFRAGWPWLSAGRVLPVAPVKKSRASGQDSLSMAPGGTLIQCSSRSRTSRVATLLDPGWFTAHGTVVRLALVRRGMVPQQRTHKGKRP
jgi:hypothetical protein